MRTLVFDELTFSAAHYLPDHPKCGVIHGHTYFVRNLEIVCSHFVDIGDIKATIKEFDHKMLIPRNHTNLWMKFDEEMTNNNFGIKIALVPINGEPTVEFISLVLGKKLESIDGVEGVSFELYEGPNQGVEYP